MKHPQNAFEGLARFGYAARGVVYMLLGGLALFSGGWGGAENSEGALSSLLAQPFGRILLGIMSVGLVGFAAWRFAQGALNADHRQRDLKNAVARGGKLISAAVYLSLGVFAGAMALGLSGGKRGGGGSEENWTATLLGLPFGQLLVGTVGVCVIIGGIGNIWKAISGAFRKRLDIPSDLQKLLVPVCTYGIAARGIVFLILGGFLVFAALTVRPEQAGSVGEALDWIRTLPGGRVLFILAAVGLLAFAGSCVIYALYRRVAAPDSNRLSTAAASAGDAVRRVLPKTR